MALSLKSSLLSSAKFVSSSRPAPSVARVTVVRPLAAPRSRSQVTTKALFGFGAPKPASTGAAVPAAPSLFICIDCGWIYDGKDDFKKLPGSFKCPVCTSPKSRFKLYKGTDVKGRPNNTGSAQQKRMAAKQW